MSEKLEKAIELFNLPEETSINEINELYKKLLFEWHPDQSGKSPEKAKEMTRIIIESYKSIINYCYHYPISFSEKSITTKPLSDDPDEFWDERFGEDQLWGFSK